MPLSLTRVGLVVALLSSQTRSVTAQETVRGGAPRVACAACDDFFLFVNGAWLDTATVPASATFGGVARDSYDRNQRVLRETIEELARGRVGSGPGTDDMRKAGIFYASCMDSIRADRDGATPIASELARIATVSTPESLAAELARLHLAGVPSSFAPFVLPDFKHAVRYLLVLSQAGLGMPVPGMYLATDDAATSRKAAYREHVVRTLVLLGDASATANDEAEAVLRIETGLARAFAAPSRDPGSVYHRMSRDSLARLAPGFAWDAYFKSLGVRQPEAVNAMQPSFLVAMARLTSTLPSPDWRAYLRWSLADAAAASLSGPFIAERFDFQSRFTGMRELPPRSERCLRRVDVALGEGVGRAYVRRAFSPRAKARVLELVENMRGVLRNRIMSLGWMSAGTRREALLKLDAMRARVGYPAHWRTYDGLTIEAGPFYTNMAAANRFELERLLRRAGRAVDRIEWSTSPQTREAFYSAFGNELVLPAGILQAPLFDLGADDAANYGAIGVIIGHELTHGFDDQGRRFDAHGNLRDWWAPQDAASFNASAQRVVNQYAKFHVLDDDTLHVNPTLTLGENIADIGGVRLAYLAFERATRGRTARVVDGLTPAQRFFAAYALSNRTKHRPEIARLQAATDPHGPPRWRVNGPLINMPEFARAFGCHQGDAMVSADSARIAIW
jgi:putative endopeptidase